MFYLRLTLGSCNCDKMLAPRLPGICGWVSQVPACHSREDVMRALLMGLCFVALCGLIATTGLCRADDEEKVPLDKLPKAVTDAVKKKFPKAELVSAEKEKEDGKIVYEVNFKNEGSTIEAIVTPEGKILVIEKEITVKDLPKAVADALESKYARATIKKVEEISKEDKITAYEVLLVTEKKKTLEVQFSPEGKVIQEEKKGKEEEKDKKEKDKGEKTKDKKDQKDKQSDKNEQKDKQSDKNR
jgi:hypothetical protein